MCVLTIDDVLLAFTLAMLKNSDHSRLNSAYEKICDNIDAGQPLTFASVQEVCSRRLASSSRSARNRHAGGTPGTSPAKSSAGSKTGNSFSKNKWIDRGMPTETAVFAAMLERNDIRPKDVLREAGISRYTDERAHGCLFQACMPYFGPPSNPSSDISDSDFDDSD